MDCAAAMAPSRMASLGGADMTQSVPIRTQNSPSLTQSPRPVRRRWRLARAALMALLCILVIVSLGAGYVDYRLTATVSSYSSAHFNSGHNAVWLEHEWAGSYHTQAQYDALAAQLSREQIAYVFAHVGPLDSHGQITDDLAVWAPDLVAALHTRLPNVKVLAWIGQLEAASGGPADEVVNLADAPTRLAISATATRFVRKYGFDGVHYDIEPISNNNSHFLDLLIETRQMLPAGGLISVSAQKWAPNATVASWLYRSGHAGQWWTSYYLAAVAAHVDQLAVMTYDTGMPTSGAYRIFVQQETKHILEAVDTAQHRPQLLMGVPTYSGDNRWFHSSAENMTSALAGVTAGLNSTPDNDAFVGVAIYRLAVTSDSDWKVYDHTWLGK